MAGSLLPTSASVRMTSVELPEDLQAVQITLHGEDNLTYVGNLLLDPYVAGKDELSQDDDKANSTAIDGYDQVGASYFVIAVILVYGMSIVLLIASHIKRREDKIAEDKQINKYIEDFQIVKERHARESYKNLKKAIMTKINWDKQRKPTYSTLQKSIMPLLAVGLPSSDQLSDLDTESLASSLSNVDLAAAEQYMIAKDKGRYVHSCMLNTPPLFVMQIAHFLHVHNISYYFIAHGLTHDSKITPFRYKVYA